MSKFLSILTPNLRRLSISATSASGSTTTPFPITQTLLRRKIPEGIRCRIYFTPRWRTVWPALLPPWLRTTISARAVSTSMILPLPSSPHCIPIKIVFAMETRNGQKISQHLLARCWACGCGGLRARTACSGWLRSGSLTSSLACERSGRAHLLKRRRYGFLFAGLGFDSRWRRRFRRGFLRLRRRRCFPRSLRFCFTRNDYFLRVHLPDDGKAAE